MKPLLSRDERELQVDRAADRLGYLVLTYGLLLIVMYRSFVNGEAPWDLLGLVIVGGLASTAYTVRARATSRRWMALMAVTALVAAAVALVAALVARR